MIVVLGLRPQIETEVLGTAIDATRLLVAVVDAEGRVCGVNRAVEQATGLSAEACRRRPIWDLAVVADERARLRAAFAPLREEAIPPSLLFHLVSGATSSRVIDWDVRVIGHDAAPAPSVVFTGIDLTDRLAYERRLRESDEIRRLVLDHLPAVVWATDDKLRFTFSAGRSLASLGLGPDQVAILGTSLYSYFQTTDPGHPAIAPHLRALEGTTTAFEMRWHDRLFQARVGPLSERQGVIVGTLGFAVDVTEQREAVRALQQSEARLRRLLESNVIGIAFWDEEGRVWEANEAFLRLIGFTRDELLAGAVSWRATTAPEHRAAVERAVAEVIATGKCAPFELECLAKDGARVPVLVGAASLEESAGPRAGVSFVIDLREQVRLRKARDQLLVEEQQARTETEIANARLLMLVEGSKRLSRTMRLGDTLETLADLVVPGLADWSYVIHRGLDGGPSLVVTGHRDPNKREPLGRLRGDALDPAAPEGAPRVFRTGEVAVYEDITMEQLSPSSPAWPPVGTRDPRELKLLRELGMRSLLCVPIPGRMGVDAVLMLASSVDPHRYDRDDIVLAQDLAQRAAVSLENGRLLAEALESVRARDDFLAIAAHELRTPLTSLLLRIQLLGQGLEGAPSDASALSAGVDALRRGVAAAEGHARRLAELVDRLLEVSQLASHRMAAQVEDVDAVQVVRQLVTTLTPDLARAGCTVEIRGAAQVTGRWDRLRIEQVLTNLLSNAMKFGARRPIEVTLEATPTHARISVRDHGIGISSQDQSRIFGRFERAVSARHFGGLGLGLYISAQIMRAHQGSLRVESEPGEGACFIMDLPRYPAGPAAQQA